MHKRYGWWSILPKNGKTEAVKRQNGSNYNVVFTINADVPPPPPPPPVVAKRVETPAGCRTARQRTERAIRLKRKVTRTTGVISSNTVTRPAARATANTGDKIIIAIDAGHGGQDPRALSAPVVRGRKMSPSPSRVNCALCSMTIRCLKAF